MRKTTFLVAALALGAAGVSTGCEKAPRATASSASQAPQGIPSGGTDSVTPPASGRPGIHTSSDPHAGMNMGGGGMQNPHGVEGGNPHGSMPMENPHGGMAGTMPAPGPLDPATVIAGTLDVSPKLAGKVKPGDVIFLSLKRVDPATGEVVRMPLAVDRLEITKLPATFELSNQKLMQPGAKIEGQVALTARIDRDADAMTRTSGDLEVIVKTQPPQKDLKVVIDTEVP